MFRWIYLVALFSFWAQAGFYPTNERDCSPVNLRGPALGGVRDQGDLAWCYAFAAADMLAHTFDEYQTISAADIALNYNTTTSGRFMRWLNLNILSRGSRDEIRYTPHETGFNKVALIRTMHQGFCPEEIFPSEKWTKLIRTSQGWEPKEVSLKEALVDIGQLYQKRHGLTSETLPFYFALKNLTPEDFVLLLQNQSLLRVYDGIRKLVCNEDRQELSHQWKVKMVLRNPKIFQRMGEQLEFGRVVGLDYDARILENRSHRGVKISELHTSSVVGRRWDSQARSCQWLIKDSHGKSCNRYEPSYDCEEGYVWLDEALIYPNMTSIVYILSRVR